MAISLATIEEGGKKANSRLTEVIPDLQQLASELVNGLGVKLAAQTLIVLIIRGNCSHMLSW